MVQFYYSGYVLGSFVSEEVDGELEAFPLRFILQNNLLIEDVSTIAAERSFSREKGSLMFYFHPAGEFDLHFHAQEVDMVFICLSLWFKHFNNISKSSR